MEKEECVQVEAKSTMCVCVCDRWRKSERVAGCLVTVSLC